MDVTVDGLENDVFQFLLDYAWPGNVQQLEHVIEGCLNLVYDERTIGYDHLPPSFKAKMLQPPARFHEWKTQGQNKPCLNN
ncbi:hypothetical protein [Ammoniphilus sp. YIM 78166]|uniref:hypothetical protein n=1 Tax=Ammoniphilus sp. YIM 78166 TaxID=1644106 RepID=UPI0014310DF3|nr:hypothetical protein [Ammoniphilus sp. YIM 78166]